MAIALTGRRQPVFWSGGERDAKFDGNDLKGLIEELLEQLGVRGASYARRADTTALFLESATIHLGKQPLGELGLLLPPLAREHDLRDPVWLAELNLDLLIARRAAGKSFQALPAYRPFAETWRCLGQSRYSRKRVAGDPATRPPLGTRIV